MGLTSKLFDVFKKNKKEFSWFLGGSKIKGSNVAKKDKQCPKCSLFYFMFDLYGPFPSLFLF